MVMGVAAPKALDRPQGAIESPALGHLWGIGVGPGDPELITVKALNRLRQCPVVAFPAGRNGQPGMAQQILAPWLQPEQTLLPLYFPYVQDTATLETAWQAAAAAVIPHLQQGQDVVFATEGDASFYSTFTYLAQTLQQQLPDLTLHTIPGICSPLAAIAALGQPLTIQDQRLTILPAMHTLDDLERALDQAEVVVLMKVAAVYHQVWTILKQRGLLAHSAVVVHASRPDQRLYPDLSDHPHLQLPYFSLMIIHRSTGIS
ncbi:precorrin-2 C(20)-methyltransferase [Leptolyngbya sp. PCC 6406]|uniref:precorrin-2 C(20)-methyltransferase n=1 Tax=Leptolyngbya sp. PCC 6406 TaxID=1173264 RepID=UPI0002ACDE60|nr:precorrin-2 C(20)-methyltransferase [Leptolyngbya sp. PCC 6406]